MGQVRISIRPLRLSDADDIYELMHMPNVLWGTFLLPSTGGDAWKLTLEQWARDERMHVFVAELQEKVVGTVQVHAGKERAQHVGTLAIAIHDKYQGQGIGKMLMLTAIDLADNWLNLLRLEGEVYTDHERALRLLKNFDFEIEGKKRCSTFRGGKYVDSYVMARLRPHRQDGYAEVLIQAQSSDADALE
jgi:putative acetyltransferase